MPVETLRCPACGAAVASGATRCSFCGVALASVACPSCFGLMFAEARFCTHCGAKADRTAVSSSQIRLCPRCQVAMSAVAIGSIHLLECGRCAGIWVDIETLQQICAEREKQASVLGMAALPDGPPPLEQHIRYLPCPACHQLMNRVNFAHCSRVIVDVCKAHGTWFDKDELRRTVEFIRGGGLEQARAQQLDQIKNEQRRLAALQNVRLPFDSGVASAYTFDNSISASAIDLLFDLLR